jgi:hypothetical protein
MSTFDIATQSRNSEAAPHQSCCQQTQANLQTSYYYLLRLLVLAQSRSNMFILAYITVANVSFLTYIVPVSSQNVSKLIPQPFYRS